MIDRSHPLKVLRGLMLSENMGDVHDEINLLHSYFGIRRPEGNFLDGFTEADFAAIERALQDEEEA